MKLSKTQQELYEAMQAGTICYFIPYAGRFNRSAYYFRDGTHARCTAAARALLERGLIERFDEKFGDGHKLRIK